MVLSYFDFTRIVFYRERLKSFSQDVKMHYRLSVKSYNHVQLDGKLVKVEIGGMNISLGLHGANGSLTSGKESSPLGDTSPQPRAEIDLDLSAKLYSSLPMLRTALLKEAGKEKRYAAADQ